VVAPAKTISPEANVKFPPPVKMETCGPKVNVALDPALNSRGRGLAGAPELAETTFLYSLATTAVALVPEGGAAIEIPVTPVPADVIVMLVTCW
jgi:hypothetical protein